MTPGAMLLTLGALLVPGCSADRPPRARGDAVPAVAAPPAAPGSVGPVAAPLLPGESREGDLAGGERRAYPVDLAAGDYARFYAEQRLPGDPGIDLVVTLIAPDGGAVEEADSPGGAAGGELLSAVVATGGTYQVVLAAADPAAPRGRYRIKLDELRAGEPDDAVRVSAEKLIHEARQLRTLETEEADSSALERLKRAIPLVSEPRDDVLEGDAFLLMGQIHLTRGRLEDARSSYQGALAAYDRASDLHSKAIVFIELGLTSKRLGNVEEALQYYRSALPILHQLGDVAEEANTLHNMGVAAISLGTLERAEDWLGRALALWRANGYSEKETAALISLSRLEKRRGDIDKASEYLQEALELGRGSGARATQAYCLSTLASIQRLKGEFQNALSSYHAALEIDRLSGNRRDEAVVWNNIGLVNLDLGNLDLALNSFEKALAISSSLGLVDNEAQALFNLGSLKARERDPHAALSYYESALSRSERLSDSFSTAVTLRLIGTTLFDLGRFDDAIESLDRALRLQLGAEDRLSEAYTRLVLGNVHLAVGDHGAARRELERTLSLSRDLRVPLVESQAWLGMAKLDRAEGALRQARGEVERAVSIYEDLRSGIFGDQLRTAFFNRSHAYYEFYLDVLMEMAREEPAAGYVASAFGVSERARARGLLDLLSEGHVDLTAGIASATREEERRLQGRTRAIEQLLLEALSRRDTKAESVEELRRKLQQREGELMRLESRIQEESPRYASLRRPSPLGLVEVQALLGERQAILEFSVGESTSYLFVVTRDRFGAFQLPSAAGLRADAETFHAAITNADRRARGAYVLAARRLYDQLIAPAEEILDGKEELLIAPDGPLYYVSFEALLTPGRTTGTWSDLPYLLRDRSISYVPSASVLATLEEDEGARARGEGEKLFVAFADPDYGATGTDSVPPATVLAEETIRGSASGERHAPLPRLLEAETEVRQIAESFGERRSALYLQAEATEANVRTSPYLRDAQWVHFATHGLIDEERPERSGLALTPVGNSADGGDDGVLRVGEIFNLSLRADLVVLSACDSGLGKVQSGEGMVGLTRAFLYAGARSLVVSLWEVEDRSTARLMVAFKRHLDAGAEKAEALRGAKMELIASEKEAVPRLWAPFVLVGSRE